MQLSKAVLAATFGRGSPHAFRAAVWRLCLLHAGALSLGLLLAHSFNGMLLTPVATPLLLLPSILLASQICIVLVLLTALRVTHTAGDALSRMLHFLPLGNVQRWLALHAPSLVLSWLTILVIIWPVCSIFIQLGAPLPLIVTAVGLGAMSAWGLFHGTQGTIGGFRGVLIALVLWDEYMLVQIAGTPLTPTWQLYAAMSFGGLFLITFMAMLLRSVMNVAHAIEVQQVTPLKIVWPMGLWWLAQSLRARHIRLDVMAAWCISLGIAVVATRHDFNDPAALVLAAAVLAASVAAGTRSLARPYNPPEIIAVRGTVYFLCSQVVLATMLSLIAISPLLYIVATPTLGMDWLARFELLLQLGIGITAGLLAGSLLTPGTRDIMGQFLAMLLVLGIMLGVPAVIKNTSLALLPLPLLLLAGFIEYKRNTYKWRNE